MIKCALSAAVGFLGLALTLAAQQNQRSDGLAPVPLDVNDGFSSSAFIGANVSLNPAWRGFPLLGLADGGRFFFPGHFGWMESPSSPAFLPPLSAPVARNARPDRGQQLTAEERDLSDEMDDSRSGLIYTGGELGFLYGKYTGKHGGDFKQGYIIGTVGNDKFSLTVGASYEESSGRFRRWRY
jgi:hypothetical protein